MYKIGPLQRISNVHGKTISQGRDVHGQTDNYKWSGMYMKGPFHKEGRYTHRQTITKDWKCTWTDNFTGTDRPLQRINCQALVPSPVPLDPIPNPEQSKSKSKSNWDWGDTKIPWATHPTHPPHR